MAVMMVDMTVAMMAERKAEKMEHHSVECLVALLAVKMAVCLVVRTVDSRVVHLDVRLVENSVVR